MNCSCISAQNQEWLLARMREATHHNERYAMKRPSMIRFVSLLLASGLFMVPPLTHASDKALQPESSGQHRLLSTELKAKIEHIQNKVKEHRHHHNGSSPSVESLQAEVADLKNQVTTLANTEGSLLAKLNATNSQMSLLSSRLTTLETGGGSGGTNPALTALSKYLAIDLNPINGVKGPHVIFTGVNFHIRSGSGSTGDDGTPTGLGNLIVGYNEGPHPDPTSGRNGSHNIVGGTLNAFTVSGGLVMGAQNWIQGEYATILGGQNNLAQGLGSSILGGRANWAGSANQTVP